MGKLVCLLYHFCILHDHKRLDVALQKILSISRSQISQWIELNLIKVNDKSAKKSQFVAKKSIVKIYTNGQIDENGKITESLQKDYEMQAKTLQIEVIHETDDYLILNKPRNLVVHHAPSVKEVTLTDYLKVNNYQCSTLNGELRFGIVHRLDKDTSGAILIAKNNESHIHFSEMLQNRTMGRIYICVINNPLQSNIFVECFMGRNPNNRLKMAKLDKARFPNARDSKSEFRKILTSKNGKFELVGVRLFSGRTHQIRLHLSTLQRYIYGDMLYSPQNLSQTYKTKMLLHAKLLYFEGNVFSAKIPKDLLKFLDENFDNYQNKLESTLSQWKNEFNALDSKDSKQK